MGATGIVRNHFWQVLQLHAHEMNTMMDLHNADIEQTYPEPDMEATCFASLPEKFQRRIVPMQSLLAMMFSSALRSHIGLLWPADIDKKPCQRWSPSLDLSPNCDRHTDIRQSVTTSKNLVICCQCQILWTQSVSHIKNITARSELSW